MADLSWFPYSTEEWERRVRELGLTCSEEGALMRLLRGAWQATEPCTVLDTPDELARLVGSEWKKALKVYRAQFAPLTDDPARRRCGWLYDLYLRQLEKHLSYKNRGHTGGKAKAAKHGPATAQLEAELEAELEAQPASLSRESSTEALSCAPAEHTAKSPPQGEARAPEGAALPAAANGTGNYLDRPEAREELLRRGVRPEQLDAAPRDSRTIAQVEAEANDLHKRHWAAVKFAADAWIAANPDEASSYERELRETFGFAVEGELSPMQERVVREGVYGEIVGRQGWPAPNEWDGKPFTARDTPTPAGASR